MPDEVTAGEAAHLPEVITVPTAGIRERTSFVIPKWLTAVLLIVPAFALFALGGASTGQCGEATELKTDVVTGQIVNCDGSEFTGQSAGGGGINYVVLGADIYAGRAVTGVNCAGCHGANGQGSGAFPSLTGVLTTFGACSDHIEWVTLGSSGFQGAGNDTYGDTSKPIGGGMPGFGSNLSDEQIAAVSAFERVRFGGGDPDETLLDCSLAEPEETEGAQEGTTESGEDTEASISHSG
jgi:cytochrome c553